MSNDTSTSAPKGRWLVRSALLMTPATMTALFLASHSAPAEEPHHSDGSFWANLRVQGNEYESYGTFEGLTQNADLVVRGTLVDFRESREIQGDAPEDIVTYAAAFVQISEVLRGSTNQQVLPVEFLLPQRIDETASVISYQALNLPAREMVLFLRDKGGPEAGKYRLVCNNGVWTTDEATGDLMAPLGERLHAERAMDSEASGLQRDRQPTPAELAAVPADAAPFSDGPPVTFPIDPQVALTASRPSTQGFGPELAHVATIGDLADLVRGIR